MSFFGDRFRIDLGMLSGSLFDDFGRTYESILDLLQIIFRTKGEMTKVCLDCACAVGIDVALHRPFRKKEKSISVF